MRVRTPGRTVTAPTRAPVTLHAVVEVTDMTAEHLAAVVALESAEQPQPWPRGVFEQELARGDDRRYLVALDGDAVVGYAGIQLLGAEAHITNVVVDRRWRRRGVAAELVTVLLEEARRRRAEAATLEVRASNAAAVALYRRFGFAPVGVRPRYYTTPPEDAIIMWLHDLAERRDGAEG